MTNKAQRTRSLILEQSYKLFAEKGFKSVSMSDICAATGLSRGGLYRYFSGTGEIMQCLLKDEPPITSQIRAGLPAVQILEEQLARSRREMMEKERNLGLAIYEYASVAPPHFFEEGNLREKARWNALICYGIGTGEFKPVDADQVTDVILYAYLGVRMWNRVIHIEDSTADHVIACIRQLLGVPDPPKA